MTTRDISYGNKYAATSNLNRTEVAKLVRADIKAAVASGDLPKAKYSVRCRSYAGGGSIDISFSHVEEAGFSLFNAERLEFDIRTNNREFTRMSLYSDRANEMTKKLDAILSAYNFDGSDSMTDYFHVRFYGHAKVCWQWESVVRDVEIERVKDAMATKAAEVLAAKETALASTIPAPAIPANDTRENPEDFNDEFPEAEIFPMTAKDADTVVAVLLADDIVAASQVDYLAAMGIEA